MTAPKKGARALADLMTGKKGATPPAGQGGRFVVGVVDRVTAGVPYVRLEGDIESALAAQLDAWNADNVPAAGWLILCWRGPLRLIGLFRLAGRGSA